MYPRKKRFLLMLLFVLLFSFGSGCNGDKAEAKTFGKGSAAQSGAPAREVEWRASGFDPQAAEYTDAVGADFSHLSEGYAAFSAKSGKRLKMQVICGEEKYNYDLPNDGTPIVCPLNMGDGDYQFRVMENIADDRYAVLWSAERSIKMDSEFEPFLRSSVMVVYDEDSECVALAKKLAEGCTTDVEEVSAVYEYLVKNLKYDYPKSRTVERGYLPDPDTTLAEKKGICFDYAALAAAMLRSRGIPCRLITGYVEPDGIYHAWNEIYLREQGWITVKIKTGGQSWKHVDITFASNGVSPARTDDASLYTKRYTY